MTAQLPRINEIRAVTGVTDRAYSGSTGSYLTGGFAQMASGAAAIANRKVEAADSMATNGIRRQSCWRNWRPYAVYRG